MKPIRVATCGVPWDYKQSLIPLMIEKIAGKIEWASLNKADLVIVGPFECALNKRKKNLLPKPLRKKIRDIEKTKLEDLSAITLFHTSENIRPDRVKTDYSIGFDFLPHAPNYFRFPYWMEFIDWSESGVDGQVNPRFGRLIKQAELLAPLKNSVFEREMKAAFFTSHLIEPRKELYSALKDIISIDGFGRAFSRNIKNHAESGIVKEEILKDYVFNFCPENSMHPGYNTEKIPEAFAAGCVPLTWTVPGENIDFNSEAYINLADDKDFQVFGDLVRTGRWGVLQRYMQHPLLSKPIGVDGLFQFLETVVLSAQG
jgi:hypothetical protein